MNKFKRGQTVKFKGDGTSYKVIRHYSTDNGFKYDILSFNGKHLILAMPEEVLTDTDEKFPQGMEDEVIRLGKKKKDKA